MISKIISILTFLSAAGIVFLWNTTNPTELGPMGVVVFFAMAYVFFLGLISIISYSGNKILLSATPEGRVKFLKNREFKFFLKYSFVFAFVPIILIAQQASGGINFFDIILLVFFQILSLVLVSKR